ncbi:hypothetical protein WR25_11646 [Diploscapter pachys]|uniref:Histone chaperone n=1 Tax=Diploscapter pachys TaxID=2018661 RepID=A0A2A2KTD0_9BILA|nr:hypothetical protein WR25_11646 [Diploscapter pachys]
MSSLVNVVSANFEPVSQPFTDSLSLEITFEAFEPLPGDLEWSLIYVPTGGTSEFDQKLDSVLVGPTPEGRHRFVFTADAPDASKIPKDDMVGASVLLLEIKYNEQKFMTLGWFVSNEYNDEALRLEPPATPQVDKLVRTIRVDDVRVTTFTIRWDPNQEDEMPPVEGEPEPEEGDSFLDEQKKEVGEEGQQEEDGEGQANVEDEESDENDEEFDLDDEEDIDEDEGESTEDEEEQDEEMEVDETAELRKEEENKKNGTEAEKAPEPDKAADEKVVEENAQGDKENAEVDMQQT